jgi:uncharacterized protein YciI
MQFILIAYDGKDEKAIERRMALREYHLKIVKEMFESGKWLYAVGILNNNGVHIGSMVVCDFPSRVELEDQWLKIEPYILGNVWERFEINRAQVASFNQDKS